MRPKFGVQAGKLLPKIFAGDGKELLSDRKVFSLAFDLNIFIAGGKAFFFLKLFLLLFFVVVVIVFLNEFLFFKGLDDLQESWKGNL